MVGGSATAVETKLNSPRANVCAPPVPIGRAGNLAHYRENWVEFPFQRQKRLPADQALAMERQAVKDQAACRKANAEIRFHPGRREKNQRP